MLPLLSAQSFQFQAVPAQLVQAAAAMGYRELALTDINSLHGLVEFVTAAQAAGVRPLLGATVQVAGQGNLILLVKGDSPPEPLVAAVNAAALKGHASPQCLAQGELLVLAAEGSAIYAALGRGDYSRALELARELKKLAGSNFWLTAGRNQGRWPLVRDLSQAVAAGVAACPAVRWTEPREQLAFQALTMLSPAAPAETEGLLLPPKEMAALFSSWPQAIAGAKALAEQAGGELPLGKIFLPRFGEDDKKFLRQLCQQGLRRRYPRDKGEARQRLERELEVIEAMGFSAYFLICWDLVRFARDQGIAVGPGRGSAGGSIVSYLLDITRVDPLAYNLYFERFLNPGRVSLPDIDMDFCYLRRDGSAYTALWPRPLAK